MIEISNGLFLEADLPVLYSSKLKAVIMSDVHIGYEEELAKKGVYLPSAQKRRFISIYKRSREIFGVQHFIVSGDLKHIFFKLGTQERRDLEEIFRVMKEDGSELVVTKGNHDNYLSIITDKFDNVRLVDEVKEGELLIYHGHREADLGGISTVVIGHEHPRVTLRDKLGVSRKMQCFLKVPLREGQEAIVMPSTGTYQAGNDISLLHSNFMSPIMREKAILEKAKPFGIIEGHGILEFPELALLRDIMV